jgi:hypothetical protein
MSVIEQHASKIAQAFTGEPQDMQIFVDMLSDAVRIYASGMDGDPALMGKDQFLQMGGEMYRRSDSVRREAEVETIGDDLVIGRFVSFQHAGSLSVNAPFVMVFRFKEDKIVDVVELCDWRITAYLKSILS